MIMSVKIEYLASQSEAHVRFGSFSAGHGHEACWSNPMQMTGQVECKWVGKSVQLPNYQKQKASHRTSTIHIKKHDPIN
jgi:hypothetical protein